MRLIDGHAASDHIIPSNKLYLHFQKDLEVAFEPGGDHDPQRETVSADSWRYAFNNEEKRFHENIYVSDGDTQRADEDKFLVDAFGVNYSERYRIGENEKDLLDYIKMRESGGRKLLLLVGGVGWGKTTLIKYVLLYLVNESEYLRRHIIPVYFSVDQDKTMFSSQDDEPSIVGKIETRMLTAALWKAIVPFVDIDSEPFWEYLKTSRQFSYLSSMEKDCAKIYVNDKSLLAKKISEIRMLAKGDHDFPYLAAKYLHEKLGKTIFLLFDNVDPLPDSVHKAAINYCLKLLEQYNVRVVISFRKNTYDKLSEFLETIEVITVLLKGRDVKAYLANRIKYALAEIKTSGFLSMDYKGKTLRLEDALKTWEAVLQILFDDEAVRILDKIAYHNLRRINILAKRYVSSGYIEEVDLIWEIIQKLATGDFRQDPRRLRVLLSSIITDNHETYFGSDVDPKLKDCIVNMFDGDSRLGPIMKVLILRYLRSREPSVSFAQMASAFCNVFQGIGETEYLQKYELARALQELLNCNLVVSPHQHIVIETADAYGVKGMGISDAGEFYLDKFMSYFEYVVFVKDAVSLPENTEIESCLKRKLMEERFHEVYKFLRYFFDYESKTYNGLRNRQRELFLENFVEGSKPIFISYELCRHIEQYGKTRGMSKEKVDRFGGLLQEIKRESDRWRGVPAE